MYLGTARQIEYLFDFQWYIAGRIFLMFTLVTLIVSAPVSDHLLWSIMPGSGTSFPVPDPSRKKWQPVTAVRTFPYIGK